MGDSPGPITRQRSSSRGVAPYEKPPALGRQRSSTDGLTGAIGSQGFLTALRTALPDATEGKTTLSVAQFVPSNAIRHECARESPRGAYHGRQPQAAKKTRRPVALSSSRKRS